MTTEQNRADDFFNPTKEPSPYPLFHEACLPCQVLDCSCGEGKKNEPYQNLPYVSVMRPGHPSSQLEI